MINQSPYACDVCGTPKGATNHWWLGYRHSYPAHKGVCVIRWSEITAKVEHTAHLCGIECVSRWVSRELASLQAQPPSEED